MRLNVFYHGHRVGQLFEAKTGTFFQYDVLWLDRGLELSPFELPHDRKVFGPFPSVTGGLPGLVYDSLPDAFGMEVLRRRFEKTGRPKPTPVQLLAYQGERTMGALTYEPCDGEPDEMLPVDVSAASDSARLIIEHNHGEKLDPALLASGATAGGAQPKILVAATPDFSQIVTGTEAIPEGMEPWIIKLSSRAEYIGPLEAAYAEMARDAGVSVPEFKLVEDSNGRRHFAVKRYDRSAEDPNERIHVHSYSSLLHLDFRDSNHDYAGLLRTTLHLTNSQSEVEEQFRRMVFNVLAHNRDDHGKNFSFLMNDEGDWTLTPAYDLIFSENDFHGNWMMVNGKRSGLTVEDFQELGGEFNIPESTVSDILGLVSTATANWSKYAAKYDVLSGYAGTIGKELEILRRGLGYGEVY